MLNYTVGCLRMHTQEKNYQLADKVPCWWEGDEVIDKGDLEGFSHVDKVLFGKLDSRYTIILNVNFLNKNKGSWHCFLKKDGKLRKIGTSLAVQWLGLWASSAAGMGLIPGQGSRIPQTARGSEKKKKKNPKEANKQNLRKIPSRQDWHFETPGTPLGWTKWEESCLYCQSFQNHLLTWNIFQRPFFF